MKQRIDLLRKPATTPMRDFAHRLVGGLVVAGAIFCGGALLRLVGG